MVSSIERFHCIQASQLGPNGALCREVPLYTYRIANWVPMVPSVERFHCIHTHMTQVLWHVTHNPPVDAVEQH